MDGTEIEECCRELRCLEAAMESALGAGDGTAALALEHFARSLARTCDRLEAAAEDGGTHG